MTFETYKKIIDINNSDIEDLEKNIRIKCLTNNINYEDIIKLNYQDMIIELNNLEIKTFQYADTHYNFTHNNEVYDLCQEMDDVNFYQYSDMQKYLESNDFLRFFTVLTYSKDKYKISGYLINDFENRVEKLKDLDSKIWYNYLSDIIKKKTQLIASSNKSLVTKEMVMNLQKIFIENISQYSASLLSHLKTQKQKKNWITYYTQMWSLQLISYLLKLTKPASVVKLINIILKMIIKK